MYQNHQIYSVTELEELSNKHQSFVVLKKSVIKVLLAPAYIGNVKKGIFNALVKKLRVYDNTLEGILLGFGKVRVDLSAGRFYGKNAEIQYPVVCHCYVFQPVVGELLCGTVNQISPDHVSCIVHKYFNATIKRPEEEPYDYWNNRPINFNDELSFFIRDLDYTGRIPYIEGALESPYIPEEPEPVKATHELPENVNFDIPQEPNIDRPSSESGIENPKTTIRGKKRKRESSSDEETESVISSTQLPGPSDHKHSDSGLDFDFLSPIRAKDSLKPKTASPKKTTSKKSKAVDKLRMQLLKEKKKWLQDTSDSDASSVKSKKSKSVTIANGSKSNKSSKLAKSLFNTSKKNNVNVKAKKIKLET